MAETDELLAHNDDYAAEYSAAEISAAPKRHVAVVACMDARLDVFALLGLEPGDAHVIRNAGGVVTDDVVRSLCVSQRLLGTREVVLVHHTDCGMGKVDEAKFLADLEADTGTRPEWSLRGFTDAASDVRDSIDQLSRSPFLAADSMVRGFVFDVDTGVLEEIGTDPSHRPERRS